MPKQRPLTTFTQATAVSPELCKTVGSAYVGSNPTAATSFRRSKSVTRPRVSGFACKGSGYADRRLCPRAICGRIRPSPRFGLERFRYDLTCGYTIDGGRVHAVVRVCGTQRAWAMRGIGDRLTDAWRTGSGPVPTVRITALLSPAMTAIGRRRRQRGRGGGRAGTERGLSGGVPAAAVIILLAAHGGGVWPLRARAPRSLVRRWRGRAGNELASRAGRGSGRGRRGSGRRARE